MPHYKDGTQAQVGDRVRGASYNRGLVEEEGVLVQITAQADVCNCKVWFPARLAPAPVTAASSGHAPAWVPEGADYGEVRAFEKIVEEVAAPA